MRLILNKLDPALLLVPAIVYQIVIMLLTIQLPFYTLLSWLSNNAF